MTYLMILRCGAVVKGSGSRRYGLAKFARLALANNPTMLDIVWADEGDVLHMDDYGAALRAARSLFLSRKMAQTYAGYAADQLRRMETHYRWLHNPPDHQPAPPEFGAAPHPKGGFRFPDTQKERAYRAALKHWQNYQSWRANRHPERAVLEAVHGYDTKHADHLLRSYTMGIEILREQVVRQRRPDAAWLGAVLGGRLQLRRVDGVGGRPAPGVGRGRSCQLPAG